MLQEIMELIQEINIILTEKNKGFILKSDFAYSMYSVVKQDEKQQKKGGVCNFSGYMTKRELIQFLKSYKWGLQD